MPGKIRDRIRRIISGGDSGKGRPAKETMLIIFLSGILIFVILLPTEKSEDRENGRSREHADWRE